MNKNDFIAALEKRLSGIPEPEKSKAIDYYEEIICDRIEDGMSEAQAVSDFGDIDQIAEEILCAMPITSLVMAKVSNRRADDSHSQTKRQKSTSSTPLLILLAIIGSPIWLPILLTVLALTVVVYCLIWLIVAVVFILVFAFAITGAAGILFSINALFNASIPYALSVLGISLFCIGLVMFAVPVAKQCVIYTVRATKAFGNSMKRRVIRFGGNKNVEK